jgi:hypothetical protein
MFLAVTLGASPGAMAATIMKNTEPANILPYKKV